MATLVYWPEKEIKMKNIAMILALVFLTSCSTIGMRPSVCDDLSEPSLMCQTAAKFGVRLEDIGGALVIANTVAIASGTYSKADAVEVLSELRSGLLDPISYFAFRTNISLYVNKYPGLLEVAQMYINQFTSTNDILGTDRKLLLDWLDKQIEALS